MIIGVPKEIKNNEFRVGMTPGGAREFVAHGHTVLVENGAGDGSSFVDAEYAAAGAELVGTADEVFARADMIVKVKEPQAVEIARLRAGQILYTYLHLAPDYEQTMGLIGSKARSASRTRPSSFPNRTLPLLAPMSEVAGRMAAQVGATYLQKPFGGRGVLMGGVPGRRAGQGRRPRRRRRRHERRVRGDGHGRARSRSWTSTSTVCATSTRSGATRIRTLYSSKHNIEEAVYAADLVIGAVLLPGAKTPWLVTKDMLPKMKRGSVVVDVSVDQGGCIETTHATTHADPTYFVDGVLHYGVANMPGAVPNTSTLALTNATLRYGLAIADKGWKQAVADDAALAKGVNVLDGKITYKPVADAHGMEYTPLESLLG